MVDEAEAVDGLSQQGHRLVGVGLSLGGRHARALLPGETREHGVGAGDGESRIAFRQPQPFREPQCMPDVGRRAGGVAQCPAGQPAPDQRSDPVRCLCRILFDQLFEESEGPSVGVKGLGWSAELEELTAEVPEKYGEEFPVLQDLGVVVDDLPHDRDRRAELGLRLRRLARLRQ